MDLWRLGGDMVDFDVIKKLLKSFPEGYISAAVVFIPHAKIRECFSLKDCQSEREIKSKVLEWLTQSCTKKPYFNEIENITYREYMRAGINAFLGTSFGTRDIEEIYNLLGKGIRHEETIDFIKNGFDMKFLKQFK